MSSLVVELEEAMGCELRQKPVAEVYCTIGATDF
jgi:hypothetical protein